MEDIRVLSVRQPYADMIISGEKKVEYRSWSTRYRGPLLIHAGLAKARGMDWGTMDPKRGGIVGVCDLVDCRAQPGGGFGFVLKNLRPLPFIPSKGQLGLYTPDAELLAKLKSNAR